MFIMGCQPWVSYEGKRKWNKSIITSPIFSQANSGFVLYDLDEAKTLANYQGSKSFTPASNTKLLTVLAGLKTFGKTLPMLEYLEEGEQLYLLPTGYPGFGYVNAEGLMALQRLLKTDHKELTLILPEKELAPYGPGWAWDDSGYSFQVPRSILPLFGNRLVKKKSSKIDFFANDQLIPTPNFSHPNNFYAQAFSQHRTGTIPFYPDQEFIKSVLPSNATISFIDKLDEKKLKQKTTLLSTSASPFYESILKDSDNFLAEQLIIMLGKKMYGSWDEEGTVADFYTQLPNDHLFAKTGTLKHVHCLTGLLKTKRGKHVIFSFMHNQIPGLNTKWKKEMESVLLKIYRDL